MLYLVIKGAYYHDSQSDQILVPHFTGEFQMVDCTRYITKEELKDSYNKEYIKNNKDNFVEYDGKKYFYAEYSPVSTGGWDLLSDLSDLSHTENNFNF